MDLYLRKSDQGQLDPEGYRVILKDDGDEVEIGSISAQHSALIIRNHTYPSLARNQGRLTKAS